MEVLMWLCKVGIGINLADVLNSFVYLLSVVDRPMQSLRVRNGDYTIAGCAPRHCDAIYRRRRCDFSHSRNPSVLSELVHRFDYAREQSASEVVTQCDVREFSTPG